MLRINRIIPAVPPPGTVCVNTWKWSFLSYCAVPNPRPVCCFWLKVFCHWWVHVPQFAAYLWHLILNTIVWKIFLLRTGFISVSFKRFARKAKNGSPFQNTANRILWTGIKCKRIKIDNVSCGINSNFLCLLKKPGEATRIKFSYGILISSLMGSMHPRKNVAIAPGIQCVQGKDGSHFKLVIAGAMVWNKSEIMDAYEQSPLQAGYQFYWQAQWRWPETGAGSCLCTELCTDRLKDLVCRS